MVCCNDTLENYHQTLHYCLIIYWEAWLMIRENKCDRIMSCMYTWAAFRVPLSVSSCHNPNKVIKRARNCPSTFPFPRGPCPKWSDKSMCPWSGSRGLKSDRASNPQSMLFTSPSLTGPVLWDGFSTQMFYCRLCASLGQSLIFFVATRPAALWEGHVGFSLLWGTVKPKMFMAFLILLHFCVMS